MKKGTSIFLKILIVLMIIGAIECAIFAIVYTGDSTAVVCASDIDIGDIDEYTILYFEDLEVLSRYAFETVYEYRDSEGSYTDTTYYVYDASQPMDKNELFAQYYIVKFQDMNNTYITSLSVAADKDITSSLKETPLRISACVGASTISTSAFSNASDDQLRDLRETALNDYAKQHQIQRAHITLGYQTESLEQYDRDREQDTVSSRIMMAVVSVILLGGSIWLIRILRKGKEE